VDYTNSMRKLLLFLLIYHGTLYASVPDTLLACLGQEEWRFHHAKDTGPEFHLNQLFINEISALQEVQLTRRHHQAICHDLTFSPSVNLMRALLIYGARIFDTSQVPDESESFREMRLANLRMLTEELPHIFFRYLAQKQALIPYAHCFRDKVPELQTFIENYLYIEEEVPVEQLLRDKEKLSRIFDHIKNFETLRQQCIEIQRKLDLGRNLNTHTQR
jgi:hypothetical protein